MKRSRAVAQVHTALRDGAFGSIVDPVHRALHCRCVRFFAEKSIDSRVVMHTRFLA